MNASELIDRGRRRLLASNEHFGYRGEERSEATDLLTDALGHEPEDDEEIPAAVRKRYERLIARRATGEPIAYIRGWTEFRDLKLSVRRGGFVPRATSEFLADQAIRRLRRRKDPIAIDLACGIGPVALSIAKDVPHATVHATDIASKAIAQGRKNATELGLDNITFHVGDMYRPVDDVRADVITIHPPYVPDWEIEDLPDEIKAFEPPESLSDRSSDGLELVRMAVDGAMDHLVGGGWLLIEISPSVSRQVKSLMGKAGLVDTRSTQGPMRWTRVVVGKRPG